MKLNANTIAIGVIVLIMMWVTGFGSLFSAVFP